MVDGMRAPPKIVGCQSHHADHTTNPVVDDALAEKRAMAAIVLDHEEAHQKPGRGQRKQQAKPVSDIEGGPHQEPQEHKRQHRNHDLEDAARTVRLAIAGEDVRPGAQIGSDMEVGASSIHFDEKPVLAIIDLDANAPFKLMGSSPEPRAAVRQNWSRRPRQELPAAD